MRILLLALVLVVPSFAVGQSLVEVAKREKERREKNKQDGKTARVISEEELAPPEGSAPPTEVTGSSSFDSTRQDPSEGTRMTAADEAGETELPDRIPADAPLEQKLEMFQLMKQDYENKVRELDGAIAENNERIRQLEAQIAATSALGGGGMPVAPVTGTGAAVTPMTGQETQRLTAEKNRLEAVNEQMAGRKDQLKLDLQTKGRVAGIPAGYLRF